ncbi:MAG: response regulator [Planctomycetes bacterium]|nr:response regulator [Planctomycetota bacterium]
MDEEPLENMTLDQARAEIESLRRSLRRRERDNRVLTQMYQNAERLRQTFESEKQLQHLYNDLLLSNTPNMIILLNENQEYILGSSACARLTGARHTELSLRPFNLLFRPEIDPDWVEKMDRLTREVLESREVLRFNDTIRVDGEPDIHVRTTISPMLVGTVCHGTTVAVNDVTELMLAQQRAEEAARSKASFLANMSHEIRTPMNAIKGLSELLALTPLNQTQKNYIKNIVGSADSLISVINDVLDFSKIDANRIEIVPVAYSLNKLIDEIAGVIGLRAEEKGLHLFMEIAPDIPSHLVGDDARIKQIVLNLLSNAVKYTPSGQIVLKIAYTRTGPDQIEMVCSVKDTGIGIRPEDIPLLFDAFARVDLKANRSIQGTGLGLAISQRLARSMGGDVTIDSEYGVGSTFTLRIPQEVAEDTALAAVENPEEIRVLLVGTGARMENARRMLRELHIAHTLFGEDDSDIGLAKNLSDQSRPLPDSDDGEKFSHCLYTDIIPERDIAQLRQRLPDCRFGVLRSIINSMEEPGRTDAMLFSPLVVTELSRFLNQNRRMTTRRIKQADPLSARIQVTGAKALVVDDNRINLMVCEKMLVLGLYGLEVVSASGASEGLQLCSEQAFDILFIDHMMPGMDGVEMTTAIRSRPGPNRKAPVVALTANVANDMRSYFIKCGMDDFVGKPIDRNELARVLTEWLPPEKVTKTWTKSIG